jgi:hypothetical protein
MARILASLAIVAAFSGTAPLGASVNGFSLVNQTGAPLSALSIRRTGGGQWTSLGVAPAAGARIRANFENPDCAFDLRGTVAGVGEVVWSGVNLCDVKSVTLNRDPAGRAWVDYD